MLIYTNENNPATLKILVSAQYGKKDVSVKIISLHDKDSGLEPPKHLPALEISKENQQLFIPNSACRFLFPAEENFRSQVEEYLEWESSVLTPVVAEGLGLNAKSDGIKQTVFSCLKALNEKISGKYLLNNITVADVAIWGTLYPLFKDPQLFKEYFNGLQSLSDFMKHLEELQEFKAALKVFQVHPGHVAYHALIAGAKFLQNIVCFSSTNSITPKNNKPSNESNSGDAATSVVTANELKSAEDSWKNGRNRLLELKKQESKPVLPKAGETNVLITSALPYVNNVPHLGNIIGCVLSADVFARFSRLCQHNVLYICGTDEYGTATETKALEEGLTPQQICDKYFQIHNSVYRWFSIGFDHFGRTSTPEQTQRVQSLFKQLNTNGFVTTETVAQLLCPKCQRYLADRFVEGTCPYPGCNYTDARGDQCDSCGKLVNAIELKEPRCKVCGTSPVVKNSEQFFIDLPKLEPLLRHWLKNGSDQRWSNNSQMITKTWLREGLKPRCITRDLKWGVPVPLDGYRDKVFYVWFDAPIGYMSITERYTKDWEKWWKPEKDVKVELYQFMAKDNVPFHSVMFPATMLGVNKGHTMVTHLMATEYLNYEDGKFSKSRGVGVFGTDAQETGISSDVWRFYLLYIRPESQDSNFSWTDLATRNNSELLNNLGNFVNRALVFAEKNFGGCVPFMEPTEADYNMLALCGRELKGYVEHLSKAKLRDGISYILNISRHGNQYMQSTQPWVLLKGNESERKRAGTVIGICCNISALISILLHPYMPETSAILQKQLNAPKSIFVLNPSSVEIVNYLPSGHKLGKPSPLFTKIEAAQIDALKAKYGSTQQAGGSPKKTQTQNNVNSSTIKSGDDEISKQSEKIRSLEEQIVLEKNRLAELQNKSTSPSAKSSESVESLEKCIETQGNLVRTLKQDKAPKEEVQKQVAALLEMKNKLSALTGQPIPKPNSSKDKNRPAELQNKSTSPPAEPSESVESLEKCIETQGNLVRTLKQDKAPKEEVQKQVAALLEMKNKLSALTGQPIPKPNSSKGKKK